MITVLQYKNKSYIKINNYTNYIVNDKKAQQCKGNKDWHEIDGKVEKIEQEYQSHRLILGYKLANQYLNLEGPEFPKEVAKDYFYDEYKDYEDEDNPKRAFYEPVYSEPEIRREPHQFEIIEINGVPRDLPYWCKVNFPNSLNEFKELQYLFPCSINYEMLFPLLWDKIKEKIANNKSYWMDDYKNIQTLTVSKKINIPKSCQIEEQEKYWPSFSSKKQKTRPVTRTEKWVKLFTVIGKYTRRDGDIQVPTLEGKNLADLEKKINEYISSFTSLLDDGVYNVCECCKGLGIIKVKKD
jgi:hypothetical protein